MKNEIKEEKLEVEVVEGIKMKNLEKYDAIISSLKDLFSKIMIDSIFDEYCECEYFYIHEFGTSFNCGISEDLYNVLKDLERMCNNA